MRLGLLSILCGVLSSFVSAQGPDTRPDSQPTSREATPFPYFGLVTSSRVRVRGGPGDFHSEVVRLDQGAVVRVVARKGDWLEVQIPGGLPLWVAAKSGEKEYVRRNAAGAGTVVVNDLQIRGTPSTNEPPLGELKAGDQVLVLSMNGEWAHVLMPTDHAGYIFHNLVKNGADQDGTATAFKERDEAARMEWIKQGEVSAVAEQERVVVKERQERVAAALEKYEAERRKDLLDRDATGVRSSLEAIVNATADPESPERIRAQTALDAVKTWEQDAKARRDARQAIEEADRKAKAAQITYQKDLEELRKRKELEAAQRDKGKWPYLTTGWVRLAPPLVNVIDKKTPRYAIHRGSHREFYLVSDRYDLAEFANKLVGILEWDPPETVSGSDIRVVRVKKLEVLPGSQ
jgi:SH3-like domain-containing protein